MGGVGEESQAEEMNSGSRSVQRLAEQIVDWRSEGIQLDQTRRLVQNVALAGQHSKNGYEYTLEALRTAVPLYEGKPVFLDHASNGTRPMERSARDLIGSVVNVRFEQNRVRGDIRVLDTESGRTFWALAESENQAVGMSHVVLAHRSPDRKQVMKIQEVVSVDAVVFPATTANLSEGNRENDYRVLPESYELIQHQIDLKLAGFVEDLDELELQETRRAGLFAHHLIVEGLNSEGTPEHYLLAWRLHEGEIEFSKEFKKLAEKEVMNQEWLHREKLPWFEGTQPVPEQQLNNLNQENARLILELEQYREREKQQTIRDEIYGMIESAGLPDSAVTDLFWDQLVDAGKREARLALIRERAELVKLQTRVIPRSQLRESEEQSDADEEIVRLLKTG